MCGFVGFINKKWILDESIITRMAGKIHHRGPDSNGCWLDLDIGLVISHKRLSVIDLTDAGAQPMISKCGRFVLTFNGEIYNHLELRSELESLSQNLDWNGNSDTETILRCVEIFGYEKTLTKLNGMFSIALWDRKLRILSLTRDRLGEKPLYYGWQGYGEDKTFLFSSDLVSFHEHPAFGAQINRKSVVNFLYHNYVIGQDSIYTGVSKVKPGSTISLSCSTNEIQEIVYWSPFNIFSKRSSSPYLGDEKECVDKLEYLLTDSIRKQLLSDVPIGAFLSGGIDSSTVVAIMQRESKEIVKTFTIGFTDDSYNEAGYAKAVAKHLGTDHHELIVSENDAIDVIMKLPKLYSEPFADSSQIPTYLISQLARSKVTVALSGDGGDELFCGYNRYQSALKLWGKISFVPYSIRIIIAKSIVRFLKLTEKELKDLKAINSVNNKLQLISKLIIFEDFIDFYKSLITYWSRADFTVIEDVELNLEIDNIILKVSDISNLNDFEKMMAIDLLSYLSDDILVKVDRAAMGLSLETRVPLLDYRIVEYAWSIPTGYKLKGGVSKWPLRQILYKHVPRNLVERKKMGFGVPIDTWLRGPLRDWAETLLSEQRLKEDGFFDVKQVRGIWREHKTMSNNWQFQLWGILMFQSWLDEYHRG